MCNLMALYRKEKKRERRMEREDRESAWFVVGAWIWLALLLSILCSHLTCKIHNCISITTDTIIMPYCAACFYSNSSELTQVSSWKWVCISWLNNWHSKTGHTFYRWWWSFQKNSNRWVLENCTLGYQKSGLDLENTLMNRQVKSGHVTKSSQVSQVYSLSLSLSHSLSLSLSFSLSLSLSLSLTLSLSLLLSLSLHVFKDAKSTVKEA